MGAGRYTDIVKIFPKAMGWAAVAVLCAIVTGGCATTKLANIIPEPGAVVVIVDRSMLGYQAREDQFQEIDSLAKSANEANSVFDLWAYDNHVVHLWGPTVLQAVDMIDSAENNDLVRNNSKVRGNPQPSLALDLLAKSGDISQPYGRIYLLTDGALPPNSTKPELNAALAEIATHSGWRLEVLGIAAQNRSVWQAALSSTMGNRFDLVNQKNALALLTQNRDE